MHKQTTLQLEKLEQELTTHKCIVDQLRYWLNAGATIKSSDLDKEVLVISGNQVYSGLHVEMPQDENHPWHKTMGAFHNE